MKNKIKNLFKKSTFISDIVIGMSDGLTVPFALAAGLTGVVKNSNLIYIAGIAELAAGCISMGLGGYLSRKSEEDFYKSKEKTEYKHILNHTEEEISEISDIFKSWGFEGKLLNDAINEISSNDEKWVNFMMKNELNLNKPEIGRATKSAFNIGLSYIIGGLIPLIPYFFIRNPITALEVSSIFTLVCLYIFGFFKSKFTGINPYTGGLKVMLIGAVAASISFGIAKLIA
jgi:VIT1/CCC1 family predicted Fe2+/Mn2+ transporter